MKKSKPRPKMIISINSLIISLLTSLKKTFVYAAGFVLSIFLPVRELVVVIGCLIVSDTAWGAYAAYKDKKFSKEELYTLLSKMLVYETLILISFLFDKYIIGDIVSATISTVPLFVTKIVSSVLGGVELYSINNNIDKAVGFNFLNRAKEILYKGKKVKTEVEEIINPRNEQHHEAS